jgi:hypothetical protein
MRERAQRTQGAQGAGSGSNEQSRSGIANLLTDIGEHARLADAHKAALAAAAAESLVRELVEVAPTRRYSALEDELSAQVGVRLREWADGPLDDRVGPDAFAEAIIGAAAAAVRAALKASTTDADGWWSPWRVLTAVAGISPYPLSDTAAGAVKHLRGLPGGHVLPEMPDGPTVTSQVVWARDAYGSRFGVTAAFSTPNAPERWYLWDIDACAYEPYTVHCGYYPTSEQARTAWQVGVGGIAAGEATFAPVDNHWLLAELMPADARFPERGQTADESAENLRSMRLAEVAISAVEPSRTAQQAGFDAAAAATQFTAWLQENRAGERQPEDLDDLVTELADSWCFGSPAALIPTCSPHRVAFTVLHLRNYYLDDFADQLIALLPDWVCWLAERNGTPAHLAQRCRPYALGQPHADVGADDSRPNYLTRVIE